MLVILKNIKKPLSLISKEAILIVKKDGSAFLVEKREKGSMIIPVELEDAGDEFSVSFNTEEAIKLFKKMKSSRKRVKVEFKKEEKKIVVKYEEGEGEEISFDVKEQKINLNNSLKPLVSVNVNNIELLMAFLKKGKRGKEIDFVKDAGFINFVVKNHSAYLYHLTLNNYEQFIVNNVESPVQAEVSLKCSELEILNELLKFSLTESININFFKNYIQFKSEKFTLNVFTEKHIPAISEKVIVSGIEFENFEDEDSRVKKFKEGLNDEGEESEYQKRYNKALYYLLPPFNIYVDEDKIILKKEDENLEYLKIETNRYY